MKILTLGDSWTYGSESSNPLTASWPAQMAKKYGVEVTNLARDGASNQRILRIGIEELCRNPNYDLVIWCLGPASRTEILNHGKWCQLWPARQPNDRNSSDNELDKIFGTLWHPWNDVQTTLLSMIQFMGFVKMMSPRLLIFSLSFCPNQYQKEFSWITNYRDDLDFRSLGMPLDEFNIGIKDLDRKLKSLRAIYQIVLKQQPQCFYDIVENYLYGSEIQNFYGQNIWAPGKHPNDLGYSILADYFADKIKLIDTV